MRSFSAAAAATLLSAFSLFQGATAQSGVPVLWTHPGSGITYSTWTTTSGMTFGLTLPPGSLSTDADEYIAYFSCATPEAAGEGYCGLSLGGTMQRNLLITAYPYEDEVLTQFWYAPSYDFPEIYAGDATVTQISSSVNSTHYEVEFRCQNCWAWDHNGETGRVSTTAGFLVMGWAHSFSSPGNAQCPAQITVEQHDRQSIFGAGLDPSIEAPAYDEYVELATITATGDCGAVTPPPSSTDPGEPGPTSSLAPPETGVPVPDEEYDYVIVGGGAGGLPLADKLSEAGHKVLLIEKGPASSGRWGGTRGPWWLQDTNLTRFDVPGLCNQIWHDSAGIACRDTDQMSGCLLGGGTAINAALWWRPYSQDWDYNFPAGWRASDMAAAEQRAFSRIPGTTTPSMDGEIYLPRGMDVIREGLRSGGWNEVDFLSTPNQKNHTFGYTPYMFSNGERGGPMATYLVSATARPNFTLWLNTAVRRVVRQGGHVTGIEVEPYLEGGYQGTVRLKPVTGSVILSAGTFGSAKILMRSGIGPEDQLNVVSNSTVDGSSMISRDQWIRLPVGYNLEDHVNTNTVLRHPDAQFYDFYDAYDGEDAYLPDIQQYLSSRTGILAQSAPNIGPLFFDEITGADGIVRQLQWTARIEGSEGEPDGQSITISQYLGRGATSRGRMTITPNLNTIVSDVPYLKDQEDIEAVIKGIENLQAALAGVPGLEWLRPAPNVSARQYVNNMVVSYANRRANHWIGTAKLGTNDGRKEDGDAVVDLDTRVYGTDNLYVVDASIFPGHVTPNPSSYIVVAAEHAAQRILARPTLVPAGEWEQCGGREYTGVFQCAQGLRCVELNPYYFQCIR
ncbi:cellobiose dehydrogenase [Sodiomyces alkalinus F11]|uniref:Cellobiose dehydrogenase n=1 Tax=Sodiomyces alkalinus (strain CBS 110278 / VKM F-3762 / F11) TaxID=1314773 RepID=A0A3N2PPJ7_SODAK|nr:cellobiose dehydrogenase [Sodiomyces alkalinus F11]ROT36423.1 cellobiose dehydrogenase [Sodiomyces alkalinus F11]